MTDIFFSYSSKDRERVRPVRDALVAQGFDVFWDQTVPAGVDWDTWIRSALQRSKCAVVFWSQNSVASDNVRHEATVAKTQGKLAPVLIEELRADQFPMGLYSVQGANLSAWEPGTASAEWDKLQAEVEAKLTPLWVSAKLHNAEAAIEAEKARRDAAESRIRSLQDQLAKEAQSQHGVEQARDAAASEVEGLKALLGARDEALRQSGDNASNLARQLAHQVSQAGRLEAQIEAKTETSKRQAESLSDLARKLAFETAELKESRAKQIALQQRLSEIEAELVTQREAASRATDLLNEIKAAERAAAGATTSSHGEDGMVAFGFGSLWAFGACRPDLMGYAVTLLQMAVGRDLPIYESNVSAVLGVLLAWIVGSALDKRDSAAAFWFYGLMIFAPVAVVGYLSLGTSLENWSSMGKRGLFVLGILQVTLGFSLIFFSPPNRVAKA